MRLADLAQWLLPLVACISTSASACKTMEDCSLNGICSCKKTCVCDPGWTGDDCSALDLQPVERWTGYNHTNITMPDFYREGAGNSSWGGQILHDPVDKSLFHLITGQMSHGCGLSGWRPFSKVIRAESRTGPRGPYHWVQDVLPTFHHNPGAFWSPADQKWLLYVIGSDWEVPDTCSSTKRTNNVSVSSSPDLIHWTHDKMLIHDVTNPAPWPLWTPENPTSEILLAVEGPDLWLGDTWDGKYTREYKSTFRESCECLWSEDPFLWRDKRGNWHLLVHHMIDIPLHKKGPHVGAHLYARDWRGPWNYNNVTLAYNSTVQFTDGSSTEYYRRERPKLFFSEDGEMTPLYLSNGVQEFDTRASYTLIQPIGQKWKDYEDGLGAESG